MIPLPPVAVLVGGCPSLAPLPDGPGTVEVVHVPTPAALAANNDGKVLYRQGRWAEAQARYEAALIADPNFLAPALNVACALARQDHFAEAARAAVGLVHRGFVPWAREVVEAADLAALHVRPEIGAIRSALAEAGAAWGRSVMDGLFFVARTRPAVRLDGEGVLVLSLNQEVFAWLPRVGRFRQITSDDGRVLAIVRAADGRSLIYVRAGKLVRAPGKPPVLRGLSLRRLDLSVMSASPTVELPGDIEEVLLWSTRDASAELKVRRAGGSTTYRLVGDALVVAAGLSPDARVRRPIRLTAAGVTEPAQISGPASCSYKAIDQRRAGETPRVAIRVGSRDRLIEAPFGAGLEGLPFTYEK